MEINLKRFVDVNIQPHEQSLSNGTRDTVVLFTPETSEDIDGQVYDSLASAALYWANSTLTYKYLKVFFDNGGVKVKVYQNKTYAELTYSDITALDNKYIAVAVVAADTNREACYAAVKTIASYLQVNADTLHIYGINEKILLARTYVASDASAVKNFAVKYSSTVGAEMAIAAYLTQLNIEDVDSVRDYAFTEEKSITAETLSDTDFGTLQTNNMNVVVKLSDSVRNFGGNCKDGYDLVNNYMRIMLHQTVTDKLMQLLYQKIKSTTGISKIYTVITQELEKYKDAGYLTTDKVWTDIPLKVKGADGIDYTIINKGDALTNGYIVKVLPISALSTAQKQARSAPPIYIVIADQYGIRKITIKGEVI